MERKILDCETKSGHKYQIKEYLTFDEIEPTLELTNNSEKSKKLVEAALVSLDGSPVEPYSRARQLPFTDYLEIAQKVGETINAGFPTVK